MDKKAKEILFEKYWSSAGWTERRSIDKEDFEYAKSKGLMFDPIRMDHDSLCQSIIDQIKLVNKNDLVNGFVYSLGTRELRYRSFISSYAIAKVLRLHKFTAFNLLACDTCGIYGDQSQTIDLNVLNFEKIKWGGVRLLHLEYINFDLEQAQSISFPEPSKQDKALLQNLKNLILNISEEDRPRQLEKKMSQLIKSNKAEREVILNILGICGVLETEQQKGFFTDFIPAKNRNLRPVSKTDWSYPVDWWQGNSGINEKAWEYYFG